MKKILLRLFLAAAVLVAALAIVATSSTFQTWALKRALKDLPPEFSLEFEGAGLGPKTVFIKNFVMSKNDDSHIKIGNFQARYSLIDLLFSSRLNISELKLSDAEIYVIDKKASAKDAPKAETKPGSAEKPSSPAAKAAEQQAGQKTGKSPFKFEGLPIDLNIDSLEADLKIYSNVGTGIDVKVSLKSFDMPRGKIPSKGALESSLVILYNKKSFSPIDISASILEDKSAKDSSKLNLKVSYKNKDMLLASVLLGSALESFAGELKADVSETDFSDIVSKEKLFKFSTQIYAVVKADIPKKQISANGALDILCGQPQKISDKLKSLKEVRLSGKFDVSNMDEAFSAKSLDFSLFADSEKLAVLSLAAPISVKASAPKDIVLALPDGKIASLEINNLTDSLIAGIAGADSFSFQPLRAQFGLYKVDKSLRVSTDYPVRLNMARIGAKDNPSITNLCMDISAQADFDSLKLSNIDASAELINGKEKLKINAKAAINGQSADFFAGLNGPLNPLIKAVPSAAKYGGLGLEADLSAKAANLNLAGMTAQSAISAAELSGGIFDDKKAKILEISLKDQKGMLKCDKLPISLAAAFVPDLSGNYIRADANFDASAGKISANGSIAAENISYGKLISGINPSLKFSLDKDANGARLKISDISVSNSIAQFIAGDADALFGGDFSLKSAGAKLSAKLKTLFDQPALSPYNNIASGSANLSAKYSDNALNLSIDAAGLAAKSSPETLDKLDISLLCKFADGLKFDSADVKFSANGLNGKTEASGKFKYAEVSEISVDANSIIVEDLSALPKFFSNPAAKAVPEVSAEENDSAKTPSNKARGVAARRKILRPYADAPKVSAYDKKDAKAFWDCGFQALLNAKAKAVVKGGKDILRNVRFNARLLKDSAAISGFNADLKTSPMAASGTLTFDASKDNPYSLKDAELKISKLPVGDFIGGDRPIIEGNFDIDVSLRGSGSNTNHLLNHLCGSARVVSTGGTVRPLSKDSQSGVVAETAGTLLKIGSAFFGKKVKELDGMSELAQMLSEFAFSKLEISAERNENTYDIDIKTAHIDAEDLFVEASGTVKYEADKPILEQQMNIPATIYVRENSKKHTLFESGGFAREKSSYRGYCVGPKFRIYGTPSAVKTDLGDIISKTTGAIGSSIFKTDGK